MRLNTELKLNSSCVKLCTFSPGSPELLPQICKNVHAWPVENCSLDVGCEMVVCLAAPAILRVAAVTRGKTKKMHRKNAVDAVDADAASRFVLDSLTAEIRCSRGT